MPDERVERLAGTEKPEREDGGRPRPSRFGTGTLDSAAAENVSKAKKTAVADASSEKATIGSVARVASHAPSASSAAAANRKTGAKTRCSNRVMRAR
jgi:hypothetical protein